MLLGLITDILNYARIEAGQVHDSLEPVCVGELVDAVIPLVAPQADAKSLHIEVDVGSGGCGRGGRLGQTPTSAAQPVVERV